MRALIFAGSLCSPIRISRRRFSARAVAHESLATRRLKVLDGLFLVLRGRYFVAFTTKDSRDCVGSSSCDTLSTNDTELSKNQKQ